MKHLLVPTIILALLPYALAWGSFGHRTVAYLAQSLLSRDARTYIADVLKGQDISDAAIWPDQIRHYHEWSYTAEWHYIDAQDDPPKSCGINYRRDCASESGCVVSAITNMTSRILNPSLPHTDHYHALKFLLHFIGDIHQPLHTEAEDRGGNGIHVLFDNKHTNLHSVWDSDIAEKHAGGRKLDEKDDAQRWADELLRAESQNFTSMMMQVEGCSLHDIEACALEWANEANNYVCSYVLMDDVEGVQGHDLAGEYYEGAVPIVELLIAKAGVRLASLVNAIAVVGAVEHGAQSQHPLL